MSRFLRSAAACALLAGALAPALHAQTPAPSASGIVLDARTGEPLPGASVRLDGTALGTTADRAGRFALALPPSASAARLVVTSVGYARQAAAAGADLVVHLEPATADLAPVVVTAGRGEQDRADVPLALAAVSAADLRETRPNGLAEALNRVAGVHMTDLGNEQHGMSIRQPLSLKPLFLYLEDGVPIRPAGLFNHNALIELNLAGAERIEVVRGPGSALFGSGAVGGAVNALTARGTPAPAASAQVRRTTTGYARADAQAAGTLGRVALAAGGYAARQRAGVRDHSDADKLAATLRADAPLGPRTALTATLTASALDTDTDGSLDSLSFATGRVSSLQTFTYRRVEAARGMARITHAASARHLSTVTVFARLNRVAQNPSFRLRPAGPGRAVGEVNAQRFRSLGAAVQHEVFPGRGARLVAGALVDRSPTDFRARFGTAARDVDGRFTDFQETDSLLTDYDVLLTNAAAYVQAEAVPLAGLRVVGSLRADRIRYDLDNHLAPGAFSGAADRADTFARLTPRVGAVLALAEGVGVYANASDGFVPPEAGELYRGVQVPSLRPAVFTSVDVGGFARAFGGRLAAEAALYRMVGRDEIVSVRAPDGTTADRNAGRTRHEGVELSLLAEPVDALGVRLGGTLARHVYVAFTADERPGRERVFDGRTMEQAPALVGSGEVVLRPVPGVRLAAEALRVGSYWLDPENATRYPGHTLVHLRAGVTRRGVELWANLLNALDARHATTARVGFGGAPQYTPGLPRALTLGVGTRLGR